MKKLHLTIITLLIVITASAVNYHVKPTGKDTYSGSNWTLAKQSVQNAIDNASAGDTVFVAAGVYSGGFIMRDGITVMGGYTADMPNSRKRILPANADNESEMSILDGEDMQLTLTQIVDFATPTFWDGFVIRNGSATNSEIAVGSLVYAENGTDITGIVYKLDGENGKMLSFAEAKKSWGGYQEEFTELPYLGAPVGDMNGRENTQLIMDKIIEISPVPYPPHPPYPSLFAEYAAFWCNYLSESADWHLPSTGEWQEVYAAKGKINSVLIAANSKLANGYWTSSHAGELPAWAFYFENGKSIPTLKYIEKNVRAVRSFTTSDLPAPAAVEGSILLKGNGILDHCIVDGKEVNYTGINDISIEKNWQIFPNPVKTGESFTVTGYNEAGQLQLVDISGKVVVSKKVTGHKTVITAPGNAGVYFLHLSGKTVKVAVY